MKSNEEGYPLEKWIVFILAAINFTHVMDFVMMAPLNPFLKEELAIDSTQFGILISSYTFSAGVAGLISFFYFDRFDKRSLLIYLYAGFIIGNLLCAIAPGYKFLLMARMLAGGFGGVLSIFIFSVIGDIIPVHRRGQTTGIVMAAFSAASVVGIPLGLILAEMYTIHAPFWFLSGLSTLIFGIIIWKFPYIEKKKTNDVHHWAQIQSFFKTVNVRYALALTFFMTMGGFMIVPFVSDYMVHNVGVDKNNLRYIYFFGGLTTAVTGPLVGKLADMIGKQKMYLYCALASIIPIYCITIFPPAPLWIVFSFTSVFFIFFGSRFVPAITITTSSVSPMERGKFMSINTTIQQLASAFAAMLSSVILMNNPDGKVEYFWIVGMVSTIFTVISIIVSQRIKIIS